MRYQKRRPEELHSAFLEAFNRHDLEVIVSLYESAAILVGPDRTIEGSEGIRNFYRGLFERRPTMALRTARVSRAGDLALLHGEWSWRGTAPDGSLIDRRGRSVEVVRLQPDGRWLYAIDDPTLA